MLIYLAEKQTDLEYSHLKIRETLCNDLLEYWIIRYFDFSNIIYHYAISNEILKHDIKKQISCEIQNG